MPRPRPLFAHCLLLAAAWTLCGCQYHEVPQKPVESGKFDFDLGTNRPSRVHLQFHRGSVRVRHGDALECSAIVDVSVPDHLECRELLAQLEPKVSLTDDKLTLGIERPATAPLGAIYVTYRLTLPETTNLEIETAEGQVEIIDFRARLEAHTVAGGIRARLDGGTAELRTESGSIELSGRYESALLQSVDGRLQATTSSEGEGTLDVRTTSGTVELRVPRGRRVDVSLDGLQSAIKGPVRWSNRGSGTVGAADAPPGGSLRVQHKGGTVYIRTLASAAPEPGRQERP